MVISRAPNPPERLPIADEPAVRQDACHSSRGHTGGHTGGLSSAVGPAAELDVATKEPQRLHLLSLPLVP